MKSLWISNLLGASSCCINRASHPIFIPSSLKSMSLSHLFLGIHSKNKNLFFIVFISIMIMITTMPVHLPPPLLQHHHHHRCHHDHDHHHHLPAPSTTVIIVAIMIMITYLHSPPLSTFEKTSTPSLLSSIIISGDTLIRNHNDDHNQSRGGEGCYNAMYVPCPERFLTSEAPSTLFKGRQ